MSSGERSPKRQRLEGSYSPASPLPTFDTNAFIPPQTPPPSVRMSPSWTAPGLTAGHQQTTATTLTGSSSGGSGSGATFPTPPSTSGIHNHIAGHGGMDSARQTPAGHHDDDDDVDARGRGDGQGRRDGDGDEEMTDRQAVDAEHRRTDHERERDGPDFTAASRTTSTLTSTSTTSQSLPGAGVLYRLRTAPIAPSQPHPCQDLFQLYDLKRIQASVARRDAVTGEKINVMRKSYANKVKALGLEGKNKAESNLKELEGLSDAGWGTLVDGNRTMFQAHWESQNMVLGNVNHENELLRKLDSALKMEPGRLPGKQHEHWKSMLGLDESAAPATTKASALKFPPTNALSRTAPAMAARSSAPASPRGAIRPDRSGKKRRYNDSSFEGYDNEDDGNVSTVDEMGRRISGSKRQKRKVG